MTDFSVCFGFTFLFVQPQITFWSGLSINEDLTDWCLLFLTFVRENAVTET